MLDGKLIHPSGLKEAGLIFMFDVLSEYHNPVHGPHIIALSKPYIVSLALEQHSKWKIRPKIRVCSRSYK